MSLEAALGDQERAWRERPVLRRLYAEWHHEMARELAPGPGETVELGAGLAQLKRILPHVVATDVEPTRWAEAVVDAHELPFADSSLANLVLFDVFHHLRDPARFLDEARRALRPGGRVVLVEPYCSPVSTPLYRRFHHERTDVHVDPFVPDPALGDAMEGNQALPTLAFFRHAAEFRRRWPELRLVRRRRFGLLLYPLSGGYSRRPLVPSALYRPLRAFESALTPLAPLIAFRCLVVLERAENDSTASQAGLSA
jgi:SAM-dependent methyltransferase